jgi:hypothetical protein
MTWDKRFQDEKITVPLEIKMERVADLLCSGMDGGMSACWARIDAFKYAKGVEKPEYPYIELPFLPGCAVIIEDAESRQKGKKKGKLYRLDRDALINGLKVMAEKAPRHYADWLAENDDAITGDVFLQCCTLGDIVYG